MNRVAMDAIQFYIKITPKINIDDAFIGVLMKRAKMGNNLFRDTRFHSWGFKPYYEKQFDVCEIDKVLYWLIKYDSQSITHKDELRMNKDFRWYISINFFQKS